MFLKNVLYSNQLQLQMRRNLSKVICKSGSQNEYLIPGMYLTYFTIYYPYKSYLTRQTIMITGLNINI